MHRTHTIAAPFSRTGAGSPRGHAPRRYNASSFRTARTPDTRRATSEARTLVARDGAFPVRVTIHFSARTSMLAFFRDASFAIAYLTSVTIWSSCRSTIFRCAAHPCPPWMEYA